MAKTNILLLKFVPNLGSEGDQVQVAAGYFRNYLQPRSFAKLTTQANIKHIEKLKQKRIDREQAELSSSEQLATRLKELNIAISVKTGEGGRLFGSVTTTHLAEKIAEAGIKIDHRQLHLANSVKSLGQHHVTVKLHSQVEIELPFEVVSENPVAATAA